MWGQPKGRGGWLWFILFWVQIPALTPILFLISTHRVCFPRQCVITQSSVRCRKCVVLLIARDIGRQINNESWCNGNTLDFDSSIRGSNPLLSAKKWINIKVMFSDDNRRKKGQYLHPLPNKTMVLQLNVKPLIVTQRDAGSIPVKIAKCRSGVIGNP